MRVLSAALVGAALSVGVDAKNRGTRAKDPCEAARIDPMIGSNVSVQGLERAIVCLNACRERPPRGFGGH